MYHQATSMGKLPTPLLARISRPSVFSVIKDKRADLRIDLQESLHFFTEFYEHLYSFHTLGNEMVMVELPFLKNVFLLISKQK